MYRIVKKWSDVEAKHYFVLEKFQPYDKDHNCYSCHDDWKRSRRKCHQNGPRWEMVPNAWGDREWAKKIIKRHQIPTDHLVTLLPDGTEQSTQRWVTA